MNTFVKNLLPVLGALVVSTGLFAQSVADIADVAAKVDVAPVPVKTPPPAYPDDLKANGVSGLVSVVVVINEQGEVVASEVGKASHDSFREPSLEAVKRWRFKPAQVAGKPVKAKVTIPLRFTASEA